MNQTQAIRRLTKLLGKNIAWRVNERALTGEERAEALALSKELVAKRDAARKALDARREELLANDAQYQQLKKAWSAIDDDLKRAQGQAYVHRIEVGTSSSLFFHVEAQADNWAEAVDQIEKKKGAK